jgi:Sec-independent protein translocase protein TatA
MQVIDSDDEGEVDDSVHGDKKFKTYINDNGEEVTEVMKKSNEASNRTKNAKKQEACPPTQKKASKPKEQKTIASFFSKKN